MKTILQALKRKCRRLAALLFLVISSLIPWRVLPSSNDLAGAFKRGCHLIDRIENAVVLKLYTMMRAHALRRGVIGENRAAEFAAAGYRSERDMLQKVLHWAACTLEYHGAHPSSVAKVAKVLRDGSGSARAGHMAMHSLSAGVPGFDKTRLANAHREYREAQQRYFDEKSAVRAARAQGVPA